LPAIRALVGAHQYASGPEFDALVCHLSAEFGVSASELSDLDTFIDWSHVDALARDGIAFGGHGTDHRVLTRVSSEVVQFEVETSRTVLDSRLAMPVRAFAYPGGGWDPAIARTVERNGFGLAFTIDRGSVSCTDDPFALRRINVHEDMTRSTPMFMARLTGLF
jgi:peptidoglycan/xylan/chitin deacetylase (PgdA/CDA1 family)